jgi:HAD superfamily hydrolase (TIGR01509 family)
MNPIQAIIFDMDGVVVNSEPLHERAFRAVFEEMGYGRSHGIDFPAYYGKSDLVVWRDFVARHRPPQSLEELLVKKEEKFAELLRREEPIFADIPGLLARVSARYPLALASGSRHPTINAVLALRDLRRFFRAVVSSEDVAHGKPAPDIFLRAAELLGVPARDCCVVEDSAAGVDAGLAAGMTVIAITNSLPPEKLARATRIVGTYEEIERFMFSGENIKP